MVKCKKVKKHDIVKYGGHEWFVKKKREGRCQLVRREVSTGVPIWVPTKKVKLASQEWRRQLKQQDPVKVFFGGLWCPASVLRREGNNLCVQLSFTNFTVRLPDFSNRLSETFHNYPLWREDTTSHVIYNSTLRIERSPGIMYPMQYESGTRVPSPKAMYITTVNFPLQNMPSFSMSLYKHLSAQEIMHDIYYSMSPDIPLLLRQIATQYVNFKRKVYQISNTLLHTYVEEALLHNDHRRVQELMTVGEHEEVFVRNEYAIRESFSYPYFDVKVRVSNHLEIDLLHYTVFSSPVPLPVKSILASISTPLPYEPKLFEIDTSPCLQYVLSRMLGMEEEPLQALHLREVNNFYLTEHEGFCTKTMNTFGGVINVYGLDRLALVRQLVARSPLKTLVVVDPTTISCWSSFALWYGRKREEGPVVVTTKAVLVRSWSELKGIKRIISLVMPKPHTVYDEVLRKHSAKIRWAICNTKNEHLGWHMVGERPDARARIFRSKVQLEQMGVLFPILSIQKIYCECDHDSYTHILKNTYWMTKRKIDEYLSKFLLHPSLVPIHIRGHKLTVCEGTIKAISDRFKVKEELLRERAKETCSVCLESITNPAVTSCGHVFCEVCVKELDSRKINCAMCRSKFSGYMKISETNTPGIIKMHNGSCFRISQNEEWGLKFHVLRRHRDATFVTKYSSVKSKLDKMFPKTSVVTEKALENGMTVFTKKVILVEPDISLLNLDRAWSQDLEIIQLGYRVKH